VVIAEPEPRPMGPSPHRVLHRWTTPAGDEILSVWGLPAGYRLRFPRLADFDIDPEGEAVRPCPAPGTSRETLTHLLIDQVLPRVVAHRGHPVLHAAAVQISPEAAVAFVGETGRGKSTLAAIFARAGASLLSDDAIVLCDDGEKISALATYPSLRLWPDSLERLYRERPDVSPMAGYSTKQRIRRPFPNGSAAEPVPLVGYYLLDLATPDSDAVASIDPVTPRESVIPLLSSTFQLDVTDRRRTSRLFEQTTSLADRVPAFKLRYRRGFQQLPAVHEAVARHAGTLR
jgi:hypothetical protein